MTENKKNRSKKNESPNQKKSTKKIIFTTIKFLLVTLFLVGFIVAGATVGLVIAVAKDAPEIDPTVLTETFTESSYILDADGNLIERIYTDEHRTYVELEDIPKHVQEAFIAIEDERFETHMGIDLKRIGGALWADIKAGAPVQGASTITQQLVKNVYLYERVDRDNLINDIKRKIQEAYLAIQIERQLTKDQILEAYLNKIPLGQEAHGVQAAAQTYFSKDVQDLSIAEAAMIASITKNPSRYSLFKSLTTSTVDPEKYDIIEDVFVSGQNLTLVYNDTEDIINRKNTVLDKMHELGFITDKELENAEKIEIRQVLNPKKIEKEKISSFFGVYVKKQVAEVLQTELGYTPEIAEAMLEGGGLKIYATIDTELQNRMEDVFYNFDQVLSEANGDNSPRLIDSSSFKNGNIVDSIGNVIFYKKENLLNESLDLVINKGTYVLNGDGSLTIESKKINVFPGNVDIIDYYHVNENGNLITTKLGALDLRIEFERYEGKNRKATIPADYLANNKDFYTIDDNENLIINSKYFDNSYEGVIQPQSAVVIMDYRTGELKALIGARDDLEKSSVLNRAIKSQRQPGSAIKPLSVYLPALDNGFTAGSVIDDTIHFDAAGKRWPKNWYESSKSTWSYMSYGYRGLHTLRHSVEQSINVNSVKTLDQIGIQTSLDYLDKMGLSDDIVTRDEDGKFNDEAPGALGLGGLTDGLTPLNITAAYGSIANEGVYTEPISFTRIEDRDGNVIYENEPNRNRVVSPQVAYLMSDILESTVSNGLAGRAIFDGEKNTRIPAAGKTGTTQNKGDAWFVGYSPYYVAGVWIGNDNYAIKLAEGSSIAAEFWGKIMEAVHKDHEPKGFDVPDGLVTREICTRSGKLATDLCRQDKFPSKEPAVRTEIFLKGTEPKDFCDMHKEVLIDTSTGKLANEFCPEEFVELKVLVDAPLSYDPYSPEYLAIEEDTKKIVTVPFDYDNRVPTIVCDEHDQQTKFDAWLQEWIKNGKNPEDIPPDLIDEMREYYKQQESEQNPEAGEGEGDSSEANGEEDSEVEVIDSNANEEDDDNSDGN